MRQRKLQVFLSSTYEDLIPYRLAAMEAILAAGHIPAAMEQFSPGDETAWEKSRTFIDESDAFILILGGRYGSIEPLSGKSYIQLEYEYAVEKKMPFFSLVVKEASREQRGLTIDEREKYDQFKRTVTERLCKPWADGKDVQLAILLKLHEWAAKPGLAGWVKVKSDELTTAEVTNELARLSKENNLLRSRLEALRDDYDGLSFEELVKALRETPPPDAETFSAALDWCNQSRVKQIVSKAMEAKPGNAAEFFDALHEVFSGEGMSLPIGNRVPIKKMDESLHSFLSHGLITVHRIEPQLVGRTSFKTGDMEEENLNYEGGSITYKLTDLGRRFRNRMLTVRDRAD